ncbi:unnamed protein product [Anisakis simplex]|uniref:PITH domain-containing protein n=1 Tax=Anisakis simplex TaxID=6269 RepID=A0A0M3JI90_ANISI|nr:unnamed protein product [Anisakis simplex]
MEEGLREGDVEHDARESEPNPNSDSVQNPTQRSDEQTDSVQFHAQGYDKPSDSLRFHAQRSDEQTVSVQFHAQGYDKPSDSVQFHAQRYDEPSDLVAQGPVTVVRRRRRLLNATNYCHY